MAPPGQLRIYIPHSLLNSSSGRCFGRWFPEDDLVFITAIGGTNPGQKQIPSIYWENKYKKGCANGTENCKFANTKHETNEIIELRILQSTFNGLPTCHWVNATHKLGGRILSPDVIVVLFDERNIDCVAAISQNTGRDEASEQYDTPSAVTGTLPEVDLLAIHLRELGKSRLATSSGKDGSGSTVSSQLVQSMLWPLQTTLHFVLWVASWAQLLLNMWPDRVYKFLSASTMCQQLISQGNLLKALGHKSGAGENVTNRTRCGNRILILLADLVLGCLVCYLSEKYYLHRIVSTYIVFHLKSTGVQLQDLLHWLMGIPAGLKLNSGFAHFLGHFFLYQCYLWIGYLHLLYPTMDTIIRVISLSGCLGLTVLLGAACDVISLLTFHIYCFYVYAAKIFTLQLSALVSLSRLFRGRKWNVLRNRVDSCSYDVDQLFIGTLMFTVLLFLLPTTLLFYTVFTSFQLVVLTVRGLIGVVIHHLGIFPWFTLIKWLLGGSEFRSELSFARLDSDSEGTAHICLQLKMTPLGRAIALTRETQEKGKAVLWSELIKNLLKGTVIYPWRKPTEEGEE